MNVFYYKADYLTDTLNFQLKIYVTKKNAHN